MIRQVRWNKQGWDDASESRYIIIGHVMATDTNSKWERRILYDRLEKQTTAAQEAVAYLDIGAGGYLDLGSNLPEVQLLALPKGRHALGIIGTYGIDGYVAAPVAAPPSTPVGVEGLMQLARNWCLTWGEWAHDADPGGAKENAAETALRAALTTALAQQPAACPKCDGTGEADSGGIHPWGAQATIPCDCQQPAAPGIDHATAWAEGYESGVMDERISEANIGIAGFGAKVAPARANPYLIDASPKGDIDPLCAAKRPGCNYPACGCADASPKGGSDACIWTDDGEGNWATACGEIFTLIEGVPAENKVHHCPYCGKNLQATSAEVGA